MIDFLGVSHGLPPHDVWVGAISRPWADKLALRAARNRVIGLPDDEDDLERQVEAALADPRGSQRLAAEYLRELERMTGVAAGEPVACPVCGSPGEELAALRNRAWIAYLCLSPAHAELCWHVSTHDAASPR